MRAEPVPLTYDQAPQTSKEQGWYPNKQQDASSPVNLWIHFPGLMSHLPNLQVGFQRGSPWSVSKDSEQSGSLPRCLTMNPPSQTRHANGP